MKPIKNVFEFDPRDLAEKYTDAKLTTQEVRGKQILRVHRVFLAALSSKLEGLFDEVKSVNDLIVVRNISFDALSTIINFIYTGKVTLSDRTPEFVEDFRDGLNMLKIGVSDKAEKRISEELKEMKQTTSRRRSPSQEDLNENQKRPRTRSVEKGPKSGKWEVSISPREARPVPAMVREPRRRAGPEEETGFDLRGVIAGRQARAVEERSGQEGEEDRPFSKYCFDPKWPVANPDYPADRQVGQVTCCRCSVPPPGDGRPTAGAPGLPPAEERAGACRRHPPPLPPVQPQVQVQALPCALCVRRVPGSSRRLSAARRRLPPARWGLLRRHQDGGVAARLKRRLLIISNGRCIFK
jgi:hypothetical protein